MDIIVKLQKSAFGKVVSIIRPIDDKPKHSFSKIIVLIFDEIN